MEAPLIKQIVQSGLCSGCGACNAVCPRNAIVMKISLDGTYKPYIISAKCNLCGLCEKVCPSLDNLEILTDSFGNFIRCYIGYSADITIRWKASSGGLVTTILLTLLKEGMINGAIVAIDNPNDPLKPLMTFAKSEEEIMSSMGSKYCPVKSHFKVKDLIRERGKIAVVGLPCHIRAFRKLEEVVSELKNKILVHLGLFCGKCPNFYATTYFLRKVAKIDENEVLRISYRGKGWPGRITVLTKQGEELNFEYSDWIKFSYYPHFIPIRCVLCYDITNQLADISLGDAWGLANDRVGTSVIITRTPIGENIIQRLHESGAVVLREVEPYKVSQGQGLSIKVKNSLLRIYIWKNVFEKPIPYTLTLDEYLKKLQKTSIKDFVLNLGYCTWLYIAQLRTIRTILCNSTLQISKLIKPLFT